MASNFGHHPWTVQELVSGIEKGSIRLPDIQRPFVWPNAKVRDLIDSMYRGYPVGELMFWANRETDHSTAIGDARTKTQDASMQVVDGQQRLTSLYAVLKGLKVWREDYSRERISLSFNPMTGRFEVPTPAFLRSADWIPDITAVFADQIQARHDYLARLRADQKRTVDTDLEVESSSRFSNSLNCRTTSSRSCRSMRMSSARRSPTSLCGSTAKGSRYRRRTSSSRG